MSFLDPSTIAQTFGARSARRPRSAAAPRPARRRGMAMAAPGRLGIRAVCPLDPRRRLVLIQCDGREGLLLTGPSGDQFLGWLP